jgi:cyclopropane fatty-acyl-phospholipid synthase-like methyltransferase
MNMRSQQLNLYGDNSVKTLTAHGCDIAIQRADDLDALAIGMVKNLVSNNAPSRVLEIGCGQGGQVKRMIEAGASVVVGIDAEDYSQSISQYQSELSKTKAYFIQADMRDSSYWVLPETEFEIVLSQRAIHYINYSEAMFLLISVKKYLTANSKLFISASGIASELGSGYFDGWKDIIFRYGYLSKEMQEKHNIKHPVCLYSMTDMQNLLNEAGYSVEKIWESEFGNVKAVARMM